MKILLFLVLIASLTMAQKPGPQERSTSAFGFSNDQQHCGTQNTDSNSKDRAVEDVSQISDGFKQVQFSIRREQCCRSVGGRSQGRTDRSLNR